MFSAINTKLTFAVLASTLLEMTVLPTLGLTQGQPALCVILIVFYAFYVNCKKAVLFAFLIGLCRDLLGNGLFGIEAFALGWTALGIAFFAAKCERDELFTIATASCLATLCYASLLHSVWWSLQSWQGAPPLHWLQLLLTALVTGVCAPPSIHFLRRIIFVPNKQYELF